MTLNTKTRHHIREILLSNTMTSEDIEIKVVLKDCAQRHHGELTTSWKKRTMSTLLPNIKLYERHRQWLLELGPRYEENCDEEDLERGLQRLGRQVSNAVCSFLQTAGKQLESLATLHDGPHPIPDAWGSLGARDRLLTPRYHELAMLQRVDATVAMSAAGDVMGPPLSVTGLAAPCSDTRLVFVFVPMTQFSTNLEPAYTLGDLTSRVFVPQSTQSRRSRGVSTDLQMPVLGEGMKSESLEDIPVLEEPRKVDTTEAQTQTVKTVTHGGTQTGKDLLPDIEVMEMGVGSKNALLPPEREIGVGSSEYIMADASVGSGHAIPPDNTVHRGVGTDLKKRRRCTAPGTRHMQDSIFVTNVSASSKSTVVETYDIEYEREEIPLESSRSLVDPSAGIAACHVSKSYIVSPQGEVTNLTEQWSSDSETKLSMKSDSTQWNLTAGNFSVAVSSSSKSKDNKKVKKSGNRSNSRSSSINRDRDQPHLTIHQSVRSHASDASDEYRATVRSKQRGFYSTDQSSAHSNRSNSYSRSISPTSIRENIVTPDELISKECLIGRLLLSVHSEKAEQRSPTHSLSDSARLSEDPGLLEICRSAQRPGQLEKGTLARMKKETQLSVQQTATQAFKLATETEELDNEADKEVENATDTVAASGVFYPMPTAEEEAVLPDKAAPLLKVSRDSETSSAQAELSDREATDGIDTSLQRQRALQQAAISTDRPTEREKSPRDNTEKQTTPKAPPRKHRRSGQTTRDGKQDNRLSAADSDLEKAAGILSAIEELSEVLNRSTRVLSDDSLGRTSTASSSSETTDHWRVEQSQAVSTSVSRKTAYHGRSYLYTHSEVAETMEEYTQQFSDDTVTSELQGGPDVKVIALETMFVADMDTTQQPVTTPTGSPRGLHGIASPPQSPASRGVQSRPRSPSASPPQADLRSRPASGMPEQEGTTTLEAPDVSLHQDTEEHVLYTTTLKPSEASPREGDHAVSAQKPGSATCVRRRGAEGAAPSAGSPRPKRRIKSSTTTSQSLPTSPHGPRTVSGETEALVKDSSRRPKSASPARKAYRQTEAERQVEAEVTPQPSEFSTPDRAAFLAEVDSIVPPSLSLSSSLHVPSKSSLDTSVVSSDASASQHSAASPRPAEPTPPQDQKSPSPVAAMESGVKRARSSPTKHTSHSSTSPSPQHPAASLSPASSPRSPRRSPRPDSVNASPVSLRQSVKSVTPPAVPTHTDDKPPVSPSLSPRSSTQHSVSTPSSLHSSPQLSARSVPSPALSKKSLASATLSPPLSPQVSDKSSPRPGSPDVRSPSSHRSSKTPTTPPPPAETSPQSAASPTSSPRTHSVRSEAAGSPSPCSKQSETTQPSTQHSSPDMGPQLQSPTSPPKQEHAVGIVSPSPRLTLRQGRKSVSPESSGAGPEPAERSVTPQSVSPCSIPDTSTTVQESPQLSAEMPVINSETVTIRSASPESSITQTVTSEAAESPQPSPEQAVITQATQSAFPGSPSQRETESAALQTTQLLEESECVAVHPSPELTDTVTQRSPSRSPPEIKTVSPQSVQPAEDTVTSGTPKSPSPQASPQQDAASLSSPTAAPVVSPDLQPDSEQSEAEVVKETQFSPVSPIPAVTQLTAEAEAAPPAHSESPSMVSEVSESSSPTRSRLKPKRSSAGKKSSTASTAPSPKKRPASTPLTKSKSPGKAPPSPAPRSPVSPSIVSAGSRSPSKSSLRHEGQKGVPKGLAETWPRRSPPKPRPSASPSPSPAALSPEALHALGLHAKRCVACAHKYNIVSSLATETETKSRKKFSNVSVRSSPSKSQPTSPRQIRSPSATSPSSPSVRSRTPVSAPASPVRTRDTRSPLLKGGKHSKTEASTQSPKKPSRAASKTNEAKQSPQKMSPPLQAGISRMTSPPKRSSLSFTTARSSPQPDIVQGDIRSPHVTSESSPSTRPFTPAAAATLASPGEDKTSSRLSSLSLSPSSPLRSTGASPSRLNTEIGGRLKSPPRTRQRTSSVSSRAVSLSSQAYGGPGKDDPLSSAPEGDNTARESSPEAQSALPAAGSVRDDEKLCQTSSHSSCASRGLSSGAVPEVETAMAESLIEAFMKKIEEPPYYPLQSPVKDDDKLQSSENDKFLDTELSPRSTAVRADHPLSSPQQAGDIGAAVAPSDTSVRSSDTPPALQESSLAREPVNVDLYKVAFISPSLSSHSIDSPPATAVAYPPLVESSADGAVLTSYLTDSEKTVEYSMLPRAGDFATATAVGQKLSAVTSDMTRTGAGEVDSPPILLKERKVTSSQMATPVTGDKRLAYEMETSPRPVDRKPKASPSTPPAKPQRAKVTIQSPPSPHQTDAAVVSPAASCQQPGSPTLTSMTSKQPTKTQPMESESSLATASLTSQPTEPAQIPTSTSGDAFSSQASLLKEPTSDYTSTTTSIRSLGYSTSNISPVLEAVNTESSGTSQEIRPERLAAARTGGAPRQFKAPSSASELSPTSTFMETSPPSSFMSVSPKAAARHQPAARVSPVKPTDTQRKISPARSPRVSFVGKTFSDATTSELKMMLERQRRSDKEQDPVPPKLVTDQANEGRTASKGQPKSSFLRMLVNSSEEGMDFDDYDEGSDKNIKETPMDTGPKVNIGDGSNTAFERVKKRTGGLPQPLEHVTTSLVEKRVNIDGKPPSSKVVITQKKVTYTAEPVPGAQEPSPTTQSPPRIQSWSPSANKSLVQPTPILPAAASRAAQPSPGHTSVMCPPSEADQAVRQRQPSPMAAGCQDMQGQGQKVGTSPVRSSHRGSSQSPHRPVVMDRLAFGPSPRVSPERTSMFVTPSPLRYPDARSPQRYPDGGRVNVGPPLPTSPSPSSRSEKSGSTMTTPRERARILAASLENKKRLVTRVGSAPYPASQVGGQPTVGGRYSSSAREPMTELHYPPSAMNQVGKWHAGKAYHYHSEQEHLVRQHLAGNYYSGSERDQAVRYPVLGDHSISGTRDMMAAVQPGVRGFLQRSPLVPVMSTDSSEDFSEFFSKYVNETQKRISPPRSPRKSKKTSPKRSPPKMGSPSPQSMRRRPADPYARLRRAFEKRKRNLTQIVQLPNFTDNNLAGTSRRSESEGRRVTPNTSPRRNPFPADIVVYPDMNGNPRPLDQQLHAYRHRQGVIGDSSEMLGSIRSPTYPQVSSVPYREQARDRGRRKQGRRVSWNDDNNLLIERRRLGGYWNQNAIQASESGSTAAEGDSLERSERQYHAGCLELQADTSCEAVHNVPCTGDEVDQVAQSQAIESSHERFDSSYRVTNAKIATSPRAGGFTSKVSLEAARFRRSPGHGAPSMVEQTEEKLMEQKMQKPNIHVSQRLQDSRRLVQHFTSHDGGGEGTAPGVDFSRQVTQTEECTVRKREGLAQASTERTHRRHFRRTPDSMTDTHQHSLQKEYTFQDREKRVSLMEERQQSRQYIMKRSPRTPRFPEKTSDLTAAATKSLGGPALEQINRSGNNHNRVWSSCGSVSDLEMQPVTEKHLSLSEELRNAGWSPAGLPSGDVPQQGQLVMGGDIRGIQFEEWTDEEGSVPCDCLPGEHVHDLNESANSSSRPENDNESPCEVEAWNWDGKFYTPKDVTGGRDANVDGAKATVGNIDHRSDSERKWRGKRSQVALSYKQQEEEDVGVQYYSLEVNDDLRCFTHKHGPGLRHRRRHGYEENDNINNSGNDNPGNTPYKTIPSDTVLQCPAVNDMTQDPCMVEADGAVGGVSPQESSRRHGHLAAMSSYPRTKPTMLRQRRSFGRTYLSRLLSRRQGDESDGSSLAGHQKPSCRTKSEDYTERPLTSHGMRRDRAPDYCHECRQMKQDSQAPGDSRMVDFLPAERGLYTHAAYDRTTGLVYFNTHTDGECACTVVDINSDKHDRRFVPRAFTEETVQYDSKHNENDNYAHHAEHTEDEEAEEEEEEAESVSSYDVGEVWNTSQHSSQSSIPSAYSDELHCQQCQEAYNPERGDGDVDRAIYKEPEVFSKEACMMEERRHKEESSYSTAESQACQPEEPCPPPEESIPRATFTASPASEKASTNARGPSTFTVTESMVQAYGYNPLTVSPFTARGYPRLLHDENSLDHITVPFVKRKALVFLRSDKQEFVEVGRGTYGCVYLAQATTRRGTAKVVVKDFFTDSTTWELIVHEARMLSYLQDTGVIPHFYGLLKRRSLGDDYSLIMQYFGQGKTLHTALVNKEDLPPVIWQDVAWQLARGLLLIHERHVLLNDLKGDNVLIDMRRDRKVIKYIDLGMATYRKGLNFHLPEDQMSKFNFLAPEVRAGAFTSPMSDVYSLGYLLEQINRLAKLQALQETSQRCMDDLPADRPHLPLVVDTLQIQSDGLADSTGTDVMH